MSRLSVLVVDSQSRGVPGAMVLGMLIGGGGAGGSYVAPLIQAKPFKVTVAGAGPFSFSFDSAISAGSLLFVYAWSKTGVGVAAVSGGGSTDWAYGGFSKGMYGANTAGGSQAVAITLASSDTLVGVMAEFSGCVTAEVVPDGYTGGAGPGTPSLAPSQTSDLFVAVFQIIGTGKVISAPMNGFLLHSNMISDNPGDNHMLALTYRTAGTSQSTGITVT